MAVKKISTEQLAKFHEAAQCLEHDGIEGGLQKAIELVGLETAFAMYTIMLRVHNGSMKTFPSDPKVIDMVNAIFKGNHLISEVS